MRSMAMSLLARVLVCVAILTAALRAQEPPTQAFEVASVRENKTGERSSFISPAPGGRFTAVNMPLRTLITYAYGLQSFELIGAPDWTTTTRFDIAARAAGEFPATQPGQLDADQLMVQALLADRFALRVHRETREVPIFELTLARADGRLGPQIRRSQVDCAALRKAAVAA